MHSEVSHCLGLRVETDERVAVGAADPAVNPDAVAKAGLTGPSAQALSMFAENILKEREESLRSAFKESKAAEELTIDQYNKGVSTIFELLDAQSRRLSAESLLINSSLLRITNRIKLHLAISSPLFEEI